MVTQEELADDETYADIVLDTKEECEKFGEIKALEIPRPVEGKENYLDVLARTREEFGELSFDLHELDKRLKVTRADLARALRHVAVVRYDAYGDLAGRYSFSAALLDDSGDGLIITSIHGRNENRLYLKGIAQGNPDIELSPEEEQAVVAAKGDGR